MLDYLKNLFLNYWFNTKNGKILTLQEASKHIKKYDDITVMVSHKIGVWFLSNNHVYLAYTGINKSFTTISFSRLHEDDIFDIQTFLQNECDFYQENYTLIQSPVELMNYLFKPIKKKEL